MSEAAQVTVAAATRLRLGTGRVTSEAKTSSTMEPAAVSVAHPTKVSMNARVLPTPSLRTGAALSSCGELRKNAMPSRCTTTSLCLAGLKRGFFVVGTAETARNASKKECIHSPLHCPLRPPSSPRARLTDNDLDTNAVWVDARRAVTVTQKPVTEPLDKTLSQRGCHSCHT
mmetsp:Transcript_49544/g.155607  ORF Transcript_49544/g.155607 Transcript_49544/m.155607 type:complete len:172 (-) Transcript_49544:115-630(-)